MDNDVVIKVEKVYKDFILPHERVGSVKGVFTSMFQHATSKKEEQHALRDVSFEVKKGEFFGIVGRNGSGKSTMLKILAGIYQPTKGKISTYGKLVPFIELGVGFNPELTGRDNVYLNGAMLGFSTKEVEAMYDEIVEFAELERFMDQKLKNYSSGMQVRLAFSMAVRSEADILLIDEVLAVGDTDFQRKCYDYFKKLKKNKKTVVFVSHDMEAVREYCDRAALIDENEIKALASADQVAQEYAKLFTANTATTSATDSDTGKRWGDGSIKVESIQVVMQEKIILITETIKAYKDSSDYIAGIKIKNSAGRDMTGTNTKIEKVEVTPLKKNQRTTISWEMPNMLSDGTYTIDPAIVAANGIDVFDWWDDARTFIVKKARHLPYPLDPEFKVTFNKV